MKATTLRPQLHGRKQEPIPADQIDRAALEVAHRWLGVNLSLETMLGDDRYRRILQSIARRHMRRRSQFDAKKLAAGDNDD